MVKVMVRVSVKVRVMVKDKVRVEPLNPKQEQNSLCKNYLYG